MTIRLRNRGVAWLPVTRTTTRRVFVGALVVAGLVVVGVVAAPAPSGGWGGVAHAVPASSVDGRISVRLVGLDGQTTTGVISATSGASWNGSSGYAALRADRVGSNEYRVSASDQRICPGAEVLEVPNGILTRGSTGQKVEQLQAALGTLGYDVGPVDGIFGEMTEGAVKAFQGDQGLNVDGSWKNVDADRARELLEGLGGNGWTELGVATGPISFTTAGSETEMAPGDALGVCMPNGQVVHYRGSISAVTDGAGNARTVNEVGVENYLRGVVPREVSASWGNAGGGAGMHALRAQAVGARSYALSQDRYSYARTCDTTACQAYGGSARRTGAAASANTLEHPLTDQAIAETAGRVRVWPDGTLVSTEYSASNGPRTAGGAFPAVDDAGDSVPANPNHRWTRVRSASALASSYGVGSPLVSATTPTSSSMTNQGFEGIWARFVRIQGSSSTRTETAWNFRGAQNFPSPGFEFRRVEGRTSDATFALIGDSVGQSIRDAGAIQPLVDGAFASTHYDTLVSRSTTGGGPTSGVAAAQKVPMNTDLVIVQLGYNDPSSYGPKVDAVMDALESRNVGQVAWVNLSTRSSNQGSSFSAVNTVLASKASGNAKLTVLNWNDHSSGSQRNRWFADGIHLTATGRAEFSRFLNDEARRLTNGSDNGQIEAVVVEGTGFGHGRGMSQWGAYGWAVNHGWTWEEILDHYYGGTSMGTVAVSGDVVQVVDRKVLPTQPLRAKIAGRAGVPDDGSAVAVALNVTAVDPDGPGYLTVWPCGADRPEASNVNYMSAGGAEPNAVLVQLDETGDVCIYSFAAAHVLVDVAGWFSSGFDGIVPNRVVDTRGGEGAPAGKVPPADPLRVDFALAEVPEEAVAVALNVTAVDPDGPGYLTVWPCGADQPVASNVNYLAPGVAEPNAVLVDLDETGEVCVYSFAAAHVLVDVAGWFTGLEDVSGFEPVVPERVVDTRNGIGAAAGKVAPSEPLAFEVVGAAGVPDDGAAVAVALNVTAVDPNGPGYLTVWPCGAPMPEASNVNYMASGDVEPNAVLVQLDETGEVCVYTFDDVHVLVDVSGWFSGGFEPIVPERVVDTRSGLGR